MPCTGGSAARENAELVAETQARPDSGIRSVESPAHRRTVRATRFCMSYVIPAPIVPSVEVKGSRDRFPVRRIFCVGRNYAAHAREMGNDDREPPFFFTKPADAVVANGAVIPYPPRTENFHHE